MEFLNLTLPVLFGSILVLLVYWYLQKRRPQTLTELAAMVIEAERVARVFVAGAQQIYESQQTDGVDHRYEDVEAALLDVFPNLPPPHAKRIIEAAVIGFKEARARGWLPPPEKEAPFTLESDDGDTLRVWRESPEPGE